MIIIQGCAIVPCPRCAPLWREAVLALLPPKGGAECSTCFGERMSAIKFVFTRED